MATACEAQGIKFFEGTWEQLFAEARKENKPVFIDCFTSWCGPCKMMATRTFPQKAVGDFYNSHFICYSMDMEKGEGRMVAQKFNVRFYPTLLYLDTTGAMMHRSAGALPVDRLIEQGQMALDPQNCLAGRIKRFYAGDRDTSDLMELLILVRNVDDKVQDEAMNAFWQAVPDSQKYSAYNWQRFKILDNNISSPEYRFVSEHKQAFIKLYGEEDVMKNLYQKAAYSIQRAAELKDEPLMKHAKAILDSSGDKDVMKFAATAELMFYKSSADLKTFGRLADAYVEKYAAGNADELNNLAFEAASGVSDKKLLKSALKWSEECIKIKKTYPYMDTYAHILYKLEKYKEAKQAALEAIDLAQKENTDAAPTKELLQKINSEGK